METIRENRQTKKAKWGWGILLVIGALHIKTGEKSV